MNECCTCNLKRNVTLISSIGPGLSASWQCLAIHPQSRGLNWLWGGDPGQELLLKVLRTEGSVFSKGSGEDAGGKGRCCLEVSHLGKWRLVLLGSGQLDRGARRQTFLILICVWSLVLFPPPHPDGSLPLLPQQCTLFCPPPLLLVSKEGLQCGDLSDLWTVLQSMFPNDQVRKDLRLACVGLFWGWWVRLGSLWHAWPLAFQN